jgi:hypothetical protein
MWEVQRQILLFLLSSRRSVPTDYHSHAEHASVDLVTLFPTFLSLATRILGPGQQLHKTPTTKTSVDCAVTTVTLTHY